MLNDIACIYPIVSCCVFLLIVIIIAKKLKMFKKILNEGVKEITVESDRKKISFKGNVSVEEIKRALSVFEQIQDESTMQGKIHPPRNPHADAVQYNLKDKYFE